MLSPIIFIACLLAPTVPSDPNPQNLHLTVPGWAIFIDSDDSKEVFVTSSTIPNVKLFLGFSDVKLSNTVFISVGVTSFEPNPYLPPITFGAFSTSKNALRTSKYNGSPVEPGSLVLSSTHILSAEAGIAYNKCLLENGLYKWTLTKP